MTSEELDRRLREMATLSSAWMDSPDGRAWMAREAQRARAEAHVDMSPDALDARLREMASVSALCWELARSSSDV
jgi:hypothetical protein